MREARVGMGSIAILLSLSALPAFAQCPINSGAMGDAGCPQPLSALPVYSLSGSCFSGHGSVSYDLPRGHLEASAGTNDPHFGTICVMTTTDLFRVVGPASTSPIPVSIRVRVVNSAAQFNVFSGAARDSSLGLPSPTVLHITLAVGVGVEFPVSMFVYVSTLSGGFGSGDMQFDALPPGYSLVSCQGFLNLPVPTRRLSWGRLKSGYR